MLLRAFAKINLHLRILGKRSDGYHELSTIFQAIDWCDEIRIVPSSGFTFLSSVPPSDDSNLVVRAVRAFERCAGMAANVHIELRKNVPAGAGLGGGSADAAVTFLGLQRMMQVQLSESETMSALRDLGSDVPFFAVGGRAIGRGRGDEVVPVEDAAEYWLVLVNPGISIATPEAYSWLTVRDKTNNIVGFRAEFDSGSGPADMVNDFEHPVFIRHPSLLQIRDELLRVGAFRAALSGSGSVVFGQFRTQHEAESAALTMSGRYSVKLAKPLSRAEYFSRMFQ
jgi:4-diphosphocytidyl-2-C-methyl-D-erythritol kinase